jgi:hypothetical protein
MSSAAADIIVPIRIDVGGVTSLQTNPNPATCVHKVLGKIPFLMSDLCISSIATAQKILVPNLVNSCKKPYPLKQSWIIFSWDLTYIYVRVHSPPMKNMTKIVFLLPDTCTPKENNVEPKSSFLGSKGASWM